MRTPAYWLIPTNAQQVARPNWYNVAYLRTAAYKGMGRLSYALRGLGQSDTMPANIVESWIDPATGVSLGQDASGVIYNMYTGTVVPGAQNPSSISTSTWLLIAGGALMVMLALGGRR